MKKANNFKVTGKQLSVFQKFVAALNDISEEAKTLEDVAKENEGEAELNLKYYIDDENYLLVNKEGIVYGVDGSPVEDGDYTLKDGTVLTVVDGKFNGVKEAEDVEIEKPEEAPITEEDEEAPAEMVDIEVEGVTYKVPQPVADYIKKLEGSVEDGAKNTEVLQKEVNRLLKSPSTKPAKASIKQSEEHKDAFLIGMLNYRK